MKRLIILAVALPLLAACQTLTPASLKTACDAIGGKHVYTTAQLKVLTHDQKVQAKTANDFYAKNCTKK